MTSNERGQRRALVLTARLMRERLRRVMSARLGRGFGWLVFLLFAAGAVYLRASDGARAPLEGLVTATARINAWVAAGLVALAATSQRSLADRRDGLEVLVATRGASLRSLGLARFLATAFEATRVIVLPAVMLDVLAMTLAGSAHVVWMRAAALVPVIVFGVVTGAVLGALAVLADIARPTSGRSLFIGTILLPYALFDLLGHPMLSVPGALNGLLSIGLDAFGLGALA